jgi:nucleotide-binding universal stress UspA family protein
MKLLKTILVAVDVDDAAWRATAAAATLAKQFGSELVLIHVIEPIDQSVAGDAAPDEAIRTWLNGLRDELVADGVSVSTPLCVRAKALAEIIAAAEHADAHLIVLGTRGTAVPGHCALGTTAEKIVRRSLKPVLAVAADRPLELGNILCPVDCSEASARGLANAIRLARAFRSRLRRPKSSPLPNRTRPT